MNYAQFIESKKHSIVNEGISPSFIPDMMFDFQKYIADYAIRKGRHAIFLDTGLGKTIIELTTAYNYALATNKPSLIITPLAVAQQFLGEAEKFNIPDVGYSKEGKLNGKIVITNYERLHYFNPNDFDCVILDESSILKNFDGATKNSITSFLKKIKYRYLSTATPSPNDYTELGTSSEALGYLGYMDMLTRFFKNNQNNVSKLSQISKARQGEEWYLKSHAELHFWQWISSWAISCRKPSDIGFSDENHKLPELNEITHTIRNDSPLTINGQTSLFSLPAVSFKEIKAEVRATIGLRCESSVELSKNHETSVYWVNLNDESSQIKSLDKEAVEICGSMSIDEKEEILVAFASGQIKKLITKPSITAFGLNWQHCNHSTFFPTYSYEQYYQSIRRFWRFGQKRPVTIDLVISDGQVKILEALFVKKEKAINMFEKLITNTHQDFNLHSREFNKPITKPYFL